jgi:hypothetical protein
MLLRRFVAPMWLTIGALLLIGCAAVNAAVTPSSVDPPGSRASYCCDAPAASTTRTFNSRTTTRVVERAPTDVPRSSTSAIPARRAAKAVPRGWQRGDDIWAATKAGNDPAWSTVRGRYWKNAANDPAQAGQWDAANLARMRSGRAPQRFNADKGGLESMELSHEPIPARLGGRGLVPRWPQDHAAVDPFRHPGY